MFAAQVQVCLNPERETRITETIRRCLRRYLLRRYIARANVSTFTLCALGRAECPGKFWQNRHIVIVSLFHPRCAGRSHHKNSARTLSNCILLPQKARGRKCETTSTQLSRKKLGYFPPAARFPRGLATLAFPLLFCRCSFFRLFFPRAFPRTTCVIERYRNGPSRSRAFSENRRPFQTHMHTGQQRVCERVRAVCGELYVRLVYRPMQAIDRRLGHGGHGLRG